MATNILRSRLQLAADIWQAKKLKNTFLAVESILEE